MSLIAHLDGVELSRVRFHLEFDAAFALSRETQLRLRRPLLRAARWAQETAQPEAQALLQLLDAPPPVDPLLRRRVQKPSPPFAFVPAPAEVTSGEAGDELLLEAILPGNPVSSAQLLARLLAHLGATGLPGSDARFEFCAISACAHDGTWSIGWRAGAPLEQLSLPLLNLRWLVEEHLAEEARCLSFVTPARLLHHGKPLFAADMESLAPFMLRRVTSVLATAAGVEPFADADGLLLALRSLVPTTSDLHWQDWRSLDAAGGPVDLGGVVGQLELPPLAGEDERILIYLASLFNIGRGASFGAGHFRLDPGR